jgi:asparagine synthase (glutamine-hydrolysing)
VNVLPPASRLTCRDGDLRLERYWRFRYPERPSGAPERELMEELAARLRRAVARQVRGPGRVGMALSGGLDSRMVAAAAPEGSICTAYTTGYPDSLDVEGARRLAETYGMPHLHLVPREDYLSATAAEVVWRTEGCLPFTDATSVQFHDRLRPELDIILAGHAGGALSGQTLLPGGGPSPAEMPEYLLSRTLWATPRNLEQWLSPRAWRREWEAARERLLSAAAEAADQRPGDAVTAWNMEQRQARFIHHAGQVDRCDFEVRAPLLDYELVEFFLTVPYRHRFAQRLYKRTLAVCFPEAARVPWSKTGRAVPGTAPAILWQFYASGAGRVLRKRFPALARAHRERVRTGAVIAAEMRRDRAFRDNLLVPFVLSDGFPEDILDRRTARRLIEEHGSGKNDHWGYLAVLATVALVHRHFIEWSLQAPDAVEPAPARLRAAA